MFIFRFLLRIFRRFILLESRQGKGPEKKGPDMREEAIACHAAEEAKAEGREGLLT